jgi:hypothetical protein
MLHQIDRILLSSEAVFIMDSQPLAYQATSLSEALFFILVGNSSSSDRLRCSSCIQIYTFRYRNLFDLPRSFRLTTNCCHLKLYFF